MTYFPFWSIWLYQHNCAKPKCQNVKHKQKTKPIIYFSTFCNFKMLCEIADNYFQTLNPLAERIGEDINRIKAAYENLWKELSPTEQEQIINETIIHPQVLLSYSLTIQDIYGRGGCLFSSGTKVTVDEQTVSAYTLRTLGTT